MGTRADNWSGDSVATKQRGLGNEINDVVLGLVALAGGLSAPAPEVKGRTLTQTRTLCVAQNRVTAPPPPATDETEEVGASLTAGSAEPSLGPQVILIPARTSSLTGVCPNHRRNIRGWSSCVCGGVGVGAVKVNPQNTRRLFRG